MKCVLHIGLEKTGTSSIQAFLNVNRGSLKHVGCHVLASLGTGFHRELASVVMDESVFDDLHNIYGITTAQQKVQFNRDVMLRVRNDLADVPAETESVIISSEHFSSMLQSETELLCLKHILDEWFDEYVVILYLRPQVDLATSLYSTALKFGETKDFYEFIDHQLVRRRDSYYDYFAICKRWADIFGHEAVKVRSYRPARSRPAGVVQDFIELLDLDVDLPDCDRRQNVSLNSIGQDLLRILNIFRSSELNISEGAYSSAKSLLLRECLGPGKRLGSAERCSYQKRFVNSNRKVSLHWAPAWEAEIDRSVFADAMDSSGADLELNKSGADADRIVNQVLGIIQESRNAVSD